MIDDKTAQDIQAEVDGENLPEESARIRELIASDREAAALYEELNELAGALRAVTAEQPPAELRDSIEAATAWRARGRELRERHQLPTAPSGTSKHNFREERTVKAKYVIAGLAAAGIAGVVLYFGVGYPPKSDEAAGTIGAVKKHRVEQISEGDVVLGSTAASSDWVPFADLVGDAGAIGSLSARLEAISRDLAAKAFTLDAKGALAAKAELKAIESALEAREMQLQARATEAASLQAKELAELAAKLNLGANATLDAKSVALEAKSISEQLQARQIDLVAASSKLGALGRELAAKAKLDSRMLEKGSTLDARLLQATSKLGNKNTLDAKAFQAELGAIAANLEARTAELGVKVFLARDSYLEMAAKAHADLAGARTTLIGVASQLEASSKLDAKSVDTLNARTSELQARAAELEQRSLLGMREQVDLAAKSYDTLMGMKDSLEMATRSLGAKINDLQSREALAAFSRELGAKALDASSSLSSACRNDLGAVDRALGARDVVFGAKTLEAMSKHLGAVSRTLESRATQLEAKDVQGLESKLGSVSRTLEARTSEAP